MRVYVHVRQTERLRIVNDDLPGANGITIHNDRVFIDEFRRGGRIFELYPSIWSCPTY